MSHSLNIFEILVSAICRTSRPCAVHFARAVIAERAETREYMFAVAIHDTRSCPLRTFVMTVMCFPGIVTVFNHSVSHTTVRSTLCRGGVRVENTFHHISAIYFQSTTRV